MEDGGVVVAARNLGHIHLHCHLAGSLKLLGSPMMISQAFLEATGRD